MALIVVGAAVSAIATLDRRRRWRRAEPFAGDERAAPEPALVPNTTVYVVYVGWLLIAIGGVAGAVVVS